MLKNQKPTTLKSNENLLASYLSSIKGVELLTFEEELNLSRKIQSGDALAKKKLIEANLRLVVRIAREYVTSEISIMDLIQEGNLGLMKAAERFDYKREVRFSTYASWWIKQSIVRSLSNVRRTIRLPHRKDEKLRKINKAYNSLSQSLMRTPSPSEIAAEVGGSKEDVTLLMNAAISTISLDGPQNHGSASFQDLLEDNTYSPIKPLMNKNLKEEVMKLLSTLVEREKEVVLHRFSFFSDKKSTLKKIGDKMGVSPETVRQIEIRAIKKLRNSAVNLKGFVYSN